MGPASDPQAVVDSECRVRGVADLRVVDASIMPTIPRANTNLTCIMIGERVAGFMAREPVGEPAQARRAMRVAATSPAGVAIVAEVQRSATQLAAVAQGCVVGVEGFDCSIGRTCRSNRCKVHGEEGEQGKDREIKFS